MVHQPDRLDAFAIARDDARAVVVPREADLRKVDADVHRRRSVCPFENGGASRRRSAGRNRRRKVRRCARRHGRQQQPHGHEPARERVEHEPQVSSVTAPTTAPRRHGRARRATWRCDRRW
jgi:hypothetical protein